MSTASELCELQASVSASARQSLEFLALHVLGLRISSDRCAELQAGSEPHSPQERKAVRIFRALGAGLPPPELAAHEAFLLA